MGESALTPGAAARRLGVATGTLRSWDRRYGIGPTERSPGGHRRYGTGDMARLEYMCRLVASGTAPAEAAQTALSLSDPLAARATPPPSGVPGSAASAPTARPGGHTVPAGSAGASCQGLARAAMRLDTDTVERLLADSVEEHGVMTTWEELAMPVLHGIGAKWSHTRQYVEVEHLLSWSVSSVLRRVCADAGGAAQRRPVLLACMPDELHTLPLEALGAALCERGVTHRMLGAAAPADAVAAALRRTAPAALVLWSLRSTQVTMPALRQIREALDGGARREKTTLYLAGPGWPEAARRLVAHVDSLPAALHALVGSD
ncbi:MerR family transcriptional regulator [Salinactinospora qingdaonensis]|uniref:MerR family transcriptional regulator n=1 Tax=Salinactinospora qingdaonensis TaxID=702744 RepID=A0ABP7GJF5_9ACTN